MTDMTGHVAAWLARLEARLAEGAVAAATALFLPDAIWRDLVALTWNIHPAEGADRIAAMLESSRERPRDFRLTGPARAVEDWIEAEFTFATRAVAGRGHVRLKGWSGSPCRRRS